MVLSGGNRVREDVWDESFDEKMAPSLGGVVLGREHALYADPVAFFERTLVTRQIADLLHNIVSVLKGAGGKKVLVLNALYGGGKTHTLLSIYHVLKNPGDASKAIPESPDVKNRFDEVLKEISSLGRVDLVVIDGYFSELAPSPMSPLDVKTYKVRTLWGYIAHSLGSYSVVRGYDEKQVVPEADKILELFRDKSVVILVDELAHYIKRFYETPDEGLRRYSLAIESFMEVLAKALDLSKRTVLVISLPLVEKHGEVFVESIYQSVKQNVENIFKALKRVSPEYVEPIAPRNIPALLKTRLFVEIDSRRARDVQDDLIKVYSENKEVFGENIGFINDIVKTYPFHPLYIETVLDILDKHAGLQRTRDLLRISRKVLREVIKDEKTYSLIMPWHIDLTKDSMRNTLLSGEYSAFTSIIEEDIVGKTRSHPDKQGLARIAALALLARTFVYGGFIAISKVDVLPSERDLALMIYEPTLFHSERWMPRDIVDVIKWVSENLVYVVKDERSGRLWFTRWVTPVKYVEERARRVDDLSAINKVIEYASRLLREPIDNIARRRERRGAKPLVSRVFDTELSKVSRYCEHIDTDTPKYLVLACLEAPEASEDRFAKFGDIMFKTKSGGSRRYANTVYIVFPSSRNRLNQALEWGKKLVACEEVERENIIDKLIIGLSAREAEIAKEILKKKLEDYKIRVLETFVLSILSVFDKVAYPHYDNKRLANTVKEADLIIQTDNLIAAVERSLSHSGVGKVKIELDFDTLDYYLRDMSIALSDGSESREVSSIIDFFYSNPRLPATTREAVKEALREGVKMLKIGVKSHGRVFFKRIYDREVPKISEAESVGSIEESDLVLPWRVALEEQLRALRRKESRDDKGIIIEDYVLRLSKGDVSVDDVLKNMDVYDLDELRIAPIVKITKRVSVDIELASSAVEVNPGEKVSLEAWVKRLGQFRGEVLLKPSAGVVDKERIVVDESFTQDRLRWDIDSVPDEPGEYKYSLKILDSEGNVLSEATVAVRVRPLGIKWIEGIPPAGSKLHEMVLESRDKQTLKPLDVLKSRLSSVAYVEGFSLEVSLDMGYGKLSKVLLNVSDAQLDDLVAITTAILSRFQIGVKDIKLSLTLKPLGESFFVMPELSDSEKKALSEYRVRYLVLGAG